MSDAIQETENYADDYYWWEPLADVLEDVTERWEYGSLLVLIIVAVLIPVCIKAWRRK